MAGRNVFKVLLNCLIAAFAGWLLVTWLGKGLAAPAPTVLGGFAQIENIRLPIGARTEHRLKSFIVQIKGQVDDFARVYVNNRQVTSSEMPDRPFKYITWQDPEGDYTSRFKVDRANPTDAEVEVRGGLRAGINWLMVELENSRWGACSVTVELRANRIQLEGSPYFLPQRRQVQVKLSNEYLQQRLRRLSLETNERKEFGIIPEFDAICDRSIFAFTLE
jgi:hypothetical protein